MFEYYLAIWFYKVKNYNLMKKYYLMAIDNGYVFENSNMKKNIYNLKPIEQYIYFKDIKNINIIETREISLYKNKLNLTNIFDNCPICFEKKKLIPLECLHNICSDSCYHYIINKRK